MLQSKNVNSTIHKYSYAGGLLLQETYTTSGGFTHTLDFVYDQNSRPFMLYYTTTSPDPAVGTNTYIYYYLLNLQGDVVRLVNSSGETIANYEYDPWGCVLSVKNGNGGYITSPNHIGNINPLRYRGYYFDAETGWYYLQTRYYDPAIGRFINADSYISTGQGFIGCNMFAYALNNPILFADHTGDITGVAETFLIYAIVAAGIAAIGYFMYTPAAQRSLNDFLVYVFDAANESLNELKSLGMKIVIPIAYTAVAITKPIESKVHSGRTTSNSGQSTYYFLPRWSKVKIDLEHITSGHRVGGNRGGPNKDRWPSWMTDSAILKAIKEAYSNAQKAGSVQYSWPNDLGYECVKQLFYGSWGNGGVIYFWFNFTTNTIETAWPK